MCSFKIECIFFTPYCLILVEMWPWSASRIRSESSGFLGESVRNTEQRQLLPGLRLETRHRHEPCRWWSQVILTLVTPRLSGTDDEAADGDLVTSESECENCGQVPGLESSVSSGQFRFVFALTTWCRLALALLIRVIMLSPHLWFGTKAKRHQIIEKSIIK